MFHTGQTAVCVSKAWWHPLRIGRTYTITGAGHDECGCPYVTVGIPATTSIGFVQPGEWCTCPFCYGKHILEPSTEWRFHASRFRPIDPLMEQLERIEKEGAPAKRPEPIPA